MDFGLSPEQLRLQEEVRAFILRERTPDLLEETEWMRKHAWGPATRNFIGKLAERGWYRPTWPKKYNGMEASHIEELIIADELSYHCVRPSMIAAAIAGPTIMRFGSDEMKQEYLPRIGRGEIEFALGYTEAQAGSDLAALDIRAVEDGDDYVINGVKLYNSHCHCAEYHWLAARTDPDAPKHKGVSLFIVDLASPGITVRPLMTMAGWRTNEVYYDNVRVSKRNLVGARGRGFYQVAVALDFERMKPVGYIRRLLDDLIVWVREAQAGGSPLSQDAIVRRRLAELSALTEVARLFSWRVAWILDQGRVPNYEASMLKVFATEAMNQLTHSGLKILGPFGQLCRDSKWVQLAGAMEYHHRAAVVETIAGGTSEIQRDIIAQRGLGLPRN